MSLLSPWSLLLILPLGGIIVLLYLLKLKRKERVVSSVMLWRDAVADIQANAPFQKLKKSLLLLLQIIALLAVIGAIARPYIRTQSGQGNRIVVILDSSASMQATDVKPSRFDDAKSRALGIVGRMGGGDTMLVMTAGSKARVVASFTSDKKSLTEAINRLKPVDTPCNMRQAMVLALSLVAGKSRIPPRIVVLSDGGFEALSDLSARDARLDFMRVGRECGNVAITGLSSRKTLSGEQQVFIGFRNYSKRDQAFNLEVYLNDQLLDVREESLKAGESRQELLKNVGNLDGRVTARLDVKDDLAVDNSGSVYLTKPRKISVLMVSKGNIFLQNALNLDPRTSVTKADTLPANPESSSGDSKYDLVVFDGVTPPSNLPQGGYLLINASCPQGPARIGEMLQRPSIVDYARDHPVSRYVDFGNVQVAEARRLSPANWATTLVESAGGVLAVAGSKGGRSFVQLSFSLLDSDFPLRVGFPIFVTNCLDWLVPAQTLNAGESIRTGQPMYIDVPANVAQIEVTDPTGSKRAIKVTQTPVIFDNTERAGVYRVTGKGVKREFACNLISMQESATEPKEAFSVGGKKFASTGKPVQTNREFFAPLVLLALAVLAFEWYAYHRRI